MQRLTLFIACLIVLSYFGRGLCCGIAMPEEIPESMREDMNETYWNFLREQQRLQSGCDEHPTTQKCQIDVSENVELQGYCSDIDGQPMCLVFDKRYQTHTTMWPNHHDCRTTESRRRVRAWRHLRATELTSKQISQAKANARRGRFPASVDVHGTPLPVRRCTVFQALVVQKQGVCVGLPGGNYGCRSGRTLKLWHPSCSDVNRQVVQSEADP